jgi:HAMP domain-containing protein
MTGFFAALAAIGVIAGGSAIMAEWSNRPLRRLLDAAAEIMRRRINARPRAELATIATAAGVSPSNQGGAFELLRIVAGVLTVDPGKLRAEDRIAALLRVERADLPDVAGTTWDDAGLPGFVTPLAYELWQAILDALDPVRWREHAARSQDYRSEEEAVSALLSRSISEMLHEYGPLLTRTS